MAKLDRLGWAGEREYEVAGFSFALRSTTEDFLASAGKALAAYRIQATEAVWPIFSVVAPHSPPEGRRGRQFHVGYVNNRQIFRYDTEAEAQAALMAGVHLEGISRLLGHHVLIDGYALVMQGRGVLVYGPEARWWAKALEERLGAARLSDVGALIELTGGELAAWPFRLTHRPTTFDRAGQRFAPLGEVVDSIRKMPVRVAIVVRAGAERASGAAVVAELMKRCCGGPRGSAFHSVASLTTRATVITTTARNESGLTRLLDVLGAG